LEGDFFADAWEGEEKCIKVFAEGGVEFASGAEESTAFELVEEFPGPAEEEPDEDDIADAMWEG
jgi:hypothetical protein